MRRGHTPSASHPRVQALRQGAKRLARSLALTGMVLAATCALGAAAASASTIFSENWETGTLNGWAAQDTSGSTSTNDPVWQVLNNPQTISVANPGINPTLVTLPDSESLPTAHGGTHAVWFGDTSSGTFCGADWASVNAGDSKGGCTSSEAYSGTLTSPPINLNGATSATLHFFSWWEIESVNADTFDLMQVEYSTDAGTTWSDPVNLNPANNPAGDHDQSYSNNGLETSPSWHDYVVDLTPAAQASGGGTIEIRFVFDTRDNLYQGFRGWLIDDISLNTPYDVPAPVISTIGTCSGTQDNPVTVINGSNFVEGSQAIVDGSPQSATSVTSSERIEIPALTDGSHTVQVQAPNGTTSNTVTITAGACAAPSVTTTGIDSSANPATVGQQVTFTATVSPTPDGGTVAFTDGSQTISGCDSVPVDTTTGAATCQTTYAGAGSHTITAAYSGDAGFLSSQSAALTETVHGVTTTAALVSSGNPSQAGQKVTYTATVTPAPDGGTVAFTDGTQTIAGCGAVTPSASTGRATCAVTYAAPGQHAVKAGYSGDARFAPSQSNLLTQVVKQHPAKCSLASLSNKVLLKKPKHGKPKITPGTLTLTAKCDQAASVTLAGKLKMVKQRKHHKATVKTFSLGPVHAKLKAGTAKKLTVKLPAAAIAGLKAGARESVTYTLTATNANGVSHASKGVAKLHGVSK